MSVFHKLISAAVVSVLAVVAVGCSGAYDQKQYEKEIVSKLSSVTKLKRAKCPENKSVKKGAKFECTAYTKDGDAYTVSMKFRNKDGDVDMVLLKLNMENVRNAIADQSVANKNPRPEVVCPDDVPIKKDNKFDCELHYAGDKTVYLVEVEQTDNEGNIYFKDKE